MRLFEGTPFDIPPKCDACGELEEACQCPPSSRPPSSRQLLSPEKQTAKLAIEKRKKGSRVTVIRGLAADDNDLPKLLTQLKTACGAGGTVKEDTLEIQGRHIDRVRDVLREIGYRVRS